MNAPEVISEFRKEYYFLSNFYPTKVMFDGLTYDNSEAAYQAQKVTMPELKRVFLGVSGAKAKEISHEIVVRADWHDVSLDLMEHIIRAKFEQNMDIRNKLLDTCNAELIEGNVWNDTFWGVCNGVGENHLGKILMSERAHWCTNKCFWETV